MILAFQRVFITEAFPWRVNICPCDGRRRISEETSAFRPASGDDNKGLRIDLWDDKGTSMIETQ
jgi:hypothetical protein